MKEKFKNLPEVLQWQIISRFARGCGLLPTLHSDHALLPQRIFVVAEPLFYGLAHCKRHFPAI